MKKKAVRFRDAEGDILFTELQNLINWFAHRNSNPDNVMMGFYDIKQELEIELVKGIRYYHKKPYDERKKLVKTMLDHRIHEMKSMYYKTHRVIGEYPERIEDLDEILIADELPTEYDSKEFMEGLKARLSPTSRSVLDAMLIPNANIANTLSMARLRALRKRKPKRQRKPWYIIRPWHVAEALGLDVKTCKLCFEEIKTVYHSNIEVS